MLSHFFVPTPAPDKMDGPILMKFGIETPHPIKFELTEAIFENQSLSQDMAPLGALAFMDQNPKKIF